jgi:hypothetical protein
MEVVMSDTNGLAEYEVTINGLPHVLQLDAETAKKTPNAKRVRKASVPVNPVVDRENAHIRTGIADGAPVVDVPTDEQREAAAARVNEKAAEQVEAEKANERAAREAEKTQTSPTDATVRKTAARRPRTSAKARAAQNKARTAEDK